jgi:hypothetical protein
LVARELREDHQPPTCECGCNRFVYGDDASFVQRDLRRGY